jgi:hypothetical protein
MEASRIDTKEKVHFSTSSIFLGRGRPIPSGTSRLLQSLLLGPSLHSAHVTESSIAICSSSIAGFRNKPHLGRYVSQNRNSSLLVWFSATASHHSLLETHLLIDIRLFTNLHMLFTPKMTKYIQIETKVGAITCDPSYAYRSFDGTCNNLQNPAQGAVGSLFLHGTFLGTSYSRSYDEQGYPPTGTTLF